jgi:hypothetical protein
MSFTDKGFNVITSDNPFIAFARKYLARVIMGFFIRLKPVRPITFKRVSQIWYSYHGMSLSKSSTHQNLKFKTGDRLPYVVQKGENKSIYQKFRNDSFHLLHIAKEPLRGNINFLNAFPFPIYIVESDADNWISLNVKAEIFVLVRPDNYILWIGENLDESMLQQILSDYFIKKTDHSIKNERK